MINRNVVTRFAPSPTGYMHIGNLRTALYSYLIAKHSDGTFILRIEDTDRERLVEGATDVIIDTLKVTGLRYDEGPGVGGENRVAPGRTLRARRTGTRALRYAHTVRVLRDDLRPFVDRHALPLPSFRSWSPRRLPGAKKHQSGLYLPCPAAATDASGDTLFTCCVTIIARDEKKKGLRVSKSQTDFARICLSLLFILI